MTTTKMKEKTVKVIVERGGGSHSHCVRVCNHCVVRVNSDSVKKLKKFGENDIVRV
jgi:hypothetical protein